MERHSITQVTSIAEHSRRPSSFEVAVLSDMIYTNTVYKDDQPDAVRDLKRLRRLANAVLVEIPQMRIVGVYMTVEHHRIAG